MVLCGLVLVWFWGVTLTPRRLEVGGRRARRTANRRVSWSWTSSRHCWKGSGGTDCRRWSMRMTDHSMGPSSPVSPWRTMVPRDCRVAGTNSTATVFVNIWCGCGRTTSRGAVLRSSANSSGVRSVRWRRTMGEQIPRAGDEGEIPPLLPPTSSLRLPSQRLEVYLEVAKRIMLLELPLRSAVPTMPSRCWEEVLVLPRGMALDPARRRLQRDAVALAPADPASLSSSGI